MANDLVTFKGKLEWMNHLRVAEKSPFTEKGKPDKWSWRGTLRPNKDELMNIMDLQSKGIKNKLSKKDDGDYSISFSRPTEIHSKTKGVIKLDPPKVTMNGEPYDGEIGNGSEGEMTVEVYPHGTPNGGKSHAARLHSVNVTKLVEYNREAPPAYDQ